MVALIIAPSPDRELVQQRVVVTCDGEMATFHSPTEPTSRLPLGTPVDDIPLEHVRIQVWLRAQAQKAIDRMRVRGYEYWDNDDIHVYGPIDKRGRTSVGPDGLR